MTDTTEEANQTYSATPCKLSLKNLKSAIKLLENTSKLPYIIYSQYLPEYSIMHGDYLDELFANWYPLFNIKRHKAFFVPSKYKKEIEAWIQGRKLGG